MALLHIVGGTVFDAIHGEVIPNGVICITDDRITAVGQAAAIATGGRDVRVIDAAGQFVMPGMIDCHVHLLSSAAPDYASRSLKELLPYTAIRGACHPHAGARLHNGARCRRPGVWQYRPAPGHRGRPGARPKALCGRPRLECAWWSRRQLLSARSARPARGAY